MTAVQDDRALHMIPMDSRPPPTFLDRLRVLTFNTTFLVYLLFAHTFQLLFLPFLLLSVLLSFTRAEPFRSIKLSSREVFRLGIKWTKEIFASILIAIVRLFGRSKFVITMDSQEELERFVKRDKEGKVTGFRIQKHAIWMSNHQCYIDWILIWIVMAYANVSEGIVIIIKASLQWAPLVGPAMQLFRFVFLSRAKPLSKSTMYETARDSVERNDPFQLVIFPEGTLYSRLTRPKSKAFAEAQGIPDMEYTLLPRSTGLLYTLRLLSTLFPSASSSSTPSPSLTLYDLTMAYSGVQPQTYAQSHYSLQSWFGRGISPPTVHLHLQTFKVDPSEIPIGQVRQSARPQHIETEITDEERKEFEKWIFERWEMKDRRMGRFKANGRGFEEEEKEGGKVEFEVEMRAEDWVRLTSVPIGLSIMYYAVGYVVVSVLTKWRS
ncbi:lysophospholipid acyltransferase family protein [Sporobolomyces salmoneus]|uniref:lysophospholipid acyltransferase family protein n=1 Tax=Sporobolomyces salmoneus TaxID=183962 RepID=UPI00317D5033